MKHNIVLTDKGVSDRCSKALAVLDYVVVRLPSFMGLSAPVDSHPDMLMVPLPDGRILTTRAYFEIARETLESLPVKWVLTDEVVEPLYPKDVLFDALAVGDTLIGREDSTSIYLRRSYKNYINVKQGYARCSVAMMSDNCAVTSDIGIANALEIAGVDVLRVTPGGIVLDGYDTGFIGGAGGKLGQNKYVFFGDLMSHPDGEKIKKFAYEHKISAVSLSDEPLSDHGGIIVV